MARKHRAKRTAMAVCRCCSVSFRMRSGARLPVCVACRRTPAGRRMTGMLSKEAADARFEESLGLGAERLAKKKPTLPPLVGEAIILKMQRGEW